MAVDFSGIANAAEGLFPRGQGNLGRNIPGNTLRSMSGIVSSATDAATILAQQRLNAPAIHRHDSVDGNQPGSNLIPQSEKIIEGIDMIPSGFGREINVIG